MATKKIKFDLTPTELELFNIVKQREENNLVTTRMDIMKTAGLSSTCWFYKVIHSLRDKGLVEKYKKQYYRTK